MAHKIRRQHELYERMSSEYSDFIDSLKVLQPEEIISRSYEKVF